MKGKEAIRQHIISDYKILTMAVSDNRIPILLVGPFSVRIGSRACEDIVYWTNAACRACEDITHWAKPLADKIRASCCLSRAWGGTKAMGLAREGHAGNAADAPAADKL